MLKLKNCENFQCKYLIKKGSRKGERCHRFSRVEGGFCTTHCKGKSLSDKCIIEHVEPVETVLKLRINRLKIDQKYMIVKCQYEKPNFVLVKNNSLMYKLKVPTNITIQENIGYLIRERTTLRSVYKID